MAPQQPFPYEAALLVAADAANVVLIGLQDDATQAQLVEGVAQHPPYGLGAVASTPEVLLADGDAQRGAAVGLLDAVQPQVADRLPVLRLDAPDDRRRIGAGLVVPFPLGLQGELRRLRLSQPVADFSVVEPADEEGQVQFLNGPQAHSFPLQDALGYQSGLMV